MAMPIDISIAKRSATVARRILIKEMWLRGEKIEDIAAKTFYAPTSIKHIAKTMGCGNHPRWTRSRPVTDDEKRAAREMRASGEDIAKIGHRLQRSGSTIHRWLSSEAR